jgi:hypothetical protein
VADLARYVQRTAVLPIAAAFALAWVAVPLLLRVIEGLVVSPLLGAASPDIPNFSAFFGIVVIGGRVVDWAGPTREGLSVCIVGIGALLIARARRRSQVAQRACPWCQTAIPVAATVCRGCRREVAR